MSNDVANPEGSTKITLELGAGDNDEGDVISIKIGIDFWNRLGLGLNADMLRKAIISHAADYISARKREIDSGTKAEKATYVVITDNDYK